MMFFSLNKVKNGPKRSYNGPNRAKNALKRQKIEFLDLKNLLFGGIFLSGIGGYTLEECSEIYKSFKSKIPQPDSERRHSTNFRTVFEIMIGPFSSCEIGKT